MTDTIPHATARQLIEALQKVDPDAIVKVWMPGTYIALIPTTIPLPSGTIILEGNVTNGR